MKAKKVQKLRHGLYKVYWKPTGTSLAAVGSLSNGDRWIAPCNWLNSPPGNQWAGKKVWDMVERMKLIREDGSL